MHLGAYDVLDPLGVGGMGDVWTRAPRVSGASCAPKTNKAAAETPL
jgi:hypothetical protein